MSDYPGKTPETRPANAPPPADQNPTVADVVGEFAKIRVRGDYLAARDGGDFPRHRYTYKNYSNNRSKIHFQGIQRIQNSRCVAISGGDHKEKTSQLFILKMDSRRVDRAWGSNVVMSGDAPEKDRVVRTFALHDKLWHAGGMSISGNILSVPIEDDRDNTSQIVFLDIKDPEQPTFFDTRIERGSEVGKASAAALCKLSNGYYVCGVWLGADRRIDFYLSKSKNFTDGFLAEFVSWPFSSLLPTSGRQADYQAINFVRQSDGSLFLVGTENTSWGAPIVSGDDVADLLRVVFPPETLAADPRLAKPEVTRIAEKFFREAEEYANMDAAGGAYVTPTGSLILYSGFHWRRDKEIRFTEYRPDVPRSDAVITDIDDAWVDLYEHANFQGRRLSVLGRQDTKIERYKKISVEGKGFGNKVSSVRFQIPAGETYRLFRDEKFRMDGDEPTHHDLVGTGKVEEIPDFERVDPEFNDEVSSSRYLEDGEN